MRKRITGRSRPQTPEMALRFMVEKTNKRLNKLQKAGLIHKSAAKKLIQTIKTENKIQYQSSGKNKIKVNTKILTRSESRYYTKLLKTFLESGRTSKISVTNKQMETRTKLKQSLGQLTDTEISDQDVEDFYFLVEDEDFRYFADKVDDSELYILIETAIDRGLGESDFINLLEQYMTVNSKEARDSASRLYNKYVLGN